MLALLVAVSLAAEPLTPERAAQIRADTEAGKAEVLKQYGNKKQSELTSDERRAVLRAQMEAERKALEKAGVEPAAWVRYEQTLGRAEYAKLKAADKALKDQGQAGTGASTEVVIQVGEDVAPDKGDVKIEAGLEAEAERKGGDGVAFDPTVEVDNGSAPAEAAPSKPQPQRQEPPGRGGAGKKRRGR